MSIKVSGGGGGGGGVSYPGVTGDGKTRGGLHIDGRLAVNTPDPGDLDFYPIVVGNGSGTTLGYWDSTGLSVNNDTVKIDAAGEITAPNVDIGSGVIALQNHGPGQALGVLQSGTSGGAILITDDSSFATLFSVSRAGEVLLHSGLGAWGHAAPATQPVLATGAGHTVDDVITLLQSYGLCKQS